MDNKSQTNQRAVEEKLGNEMLGKQCRKVPTHSWSLEVHVFVQGWVHARRRPEKTLSSCLWLNFRPVQAISDSEGRVVNYLPEC